MVVFNFGEVWKTSSESLKNIKSRFLKLFQMKTGWKQDVDPSKKWNHQESWFRKTSLSFMSILGYVSVQYNIGNCKHNNCTTKGARRSTHILRGYPMGAISYPLMTLNVV